MASVDDDVGGIILLGGAVDYPNKMGVTNYVSVTDSIPPESTYWIPLNWFDVNATNVTDIATISGGYDHINNQEAGTISGGGHNELRVGDIGTSGHGTIAGGSHNKILSGSYISIGGGTFNIITNGNGSVIPGGEYNSILDSTEATASGFSNIVRASASASVMGFENLITNAPYASVFGDGNSVSDSLYASVLGYQNTLEINSIGASVIGYQNVISNAPSSVTYGRQNTNFGSYTGMLYGQNNYIPATGNPTGFSSDIASVSGRYAVARAAAAKNHSAYKFSKNGDAQSGQYILGRSIAVAGPSSSTELRCDASSGFIFVPTNSFWTCSALVVAVDTTGTKYASWRLDFCLLKTTTATMTFPGSTATQIAVSANSATNWVIAPYSRSDSGDHWLELRATSEDTTVVKWHAVLTTSEVSWNP